MLNLEMSTALFNIDIVFVTLHLNKLNYSNPKAEINLSILELLVSV